MILRVYQDRQLKQFLKIFQRIFDKNILFTFNHGLNYFFLKKKKSFVVMYGSVSFSRLHSLFFLFFVVVDAFVL